MESPDIVSHSCSWHSSSIIGYLMLLNKLPQNLASENNNKHVLPRTISVGQKLGSQLR